MRCINDIHTAPVGESLTNERLLPYFEQAVDRLALDGEAARKLRDFVRFQLQGKRSRRTVVPNWTELREFRGRAEAFEKGAEGALDELAARVVPSVPAGVTFDAVLTTTATGNLMPGL